MKSTDLRQKRAKVIADARAILDKATGESRALTAEEQANYDKAFSDAEELRSTIERMEKQERAEIELTEIEDRGVRPEVPGQGGDDKDKEKRALEKRAFVSYLVGGRAAMKDDELRALSASAPDQGGYTIAPQDFRAMLIKAVDDEVFMRQLGTVIPSVNGASLGAPALDADPADSDWTSEIATGSEDSTMAFGKRELAPQPLAKRIKVSNKLLRASAIGIDAFVAARLAYKFGITLEKAYLTGNGASKPLGIFTASATGISTGRDKLTGSATGITMDGLIGAKYALKGQYHMRASWLFHRDGVALIAKIREGSGTGQYLWQPSTQAGQPDRLLGFPVRMSEYVPNTFTAGLYVGMLADFSHYWIADSLQLTIQRLVELYAESNQTGFIGRFETDGMPVLEEAFVRLRTD